jgi:acetolactate synthase I/II/III large subunit
MSDATTPAAQAIVRALIDGGVTHAYGIPGGYTIKIFEAIRDGDGLDAVLAPSEQIAACMADMHGRITHRPAVLTGQGAFIAGTGSFGIMEAYLSGTPMVVITEMTDHGIVQHNATQSITGDYASVDLPAILRAMTKFTTVATTPNEAVHGVQLALHHAVSGRPGPTAVIGRLDGFYGAADPTAKPSYAHTKRIGQRVGDRPSTDAVRDVAARLRGARSPVIVAGNGVHGHYDLLDALARRTAAPVVTTQKARGAVADTHPWAGGMLGPFGSPVAYALLRDADVVLVLGSRLNPADTAMESPEIFSVDRQTIIQIDCVAEHLGRAIAVSLGIVADVGGFLEALLPELGVDESVVDGRSSTNGGRGSRRCERWSTTPKPRRAHRHRYDRNAWSASSTTCWPTTTASCSTPATTASSTTATSACRCPGASTSAAVTSVWVGAHQPRWPPRCCGPTNACSASSATAGCR